MSRDNAKYRRGSSGFTLLEVLVALSIFSIASVGMAKAFANHITANSNSETRSGAVQAAQLILDNLRSQDPALLPVSGATSQTVTVGRRTFTGYIRYCSPATYCSSPNIKFIHLEVIYRGKIWYAVDTVFSQLR